MSRRNPSEALETFGPLLARRELLAALVGLPLGSLLGCGASMPVGAGRAHAAAGVAPASPVPAARAPAVAAAAPRVAPTLRARAIPLFQRYPALGERIPYLALGAWPTPVQREPELGARLGLERLFVKRDDVSGTVYGGNKVRKLETILAEARLQGRTQVLTFGGYGSNHAIATAAYAQQVGLGAILNLVAESKSERLTNALLADLKFGAEVRISGNTKTQLIMDELGARGQPPSGPYIIAPGGTSTLGNVGFVNAAFELHEQVEQGVIPEPDVIYIALGSMGSAVGLMQGLKAAKMKTRLVAVRTATPRFSSELKIQRLFGQLNRYLRGLDASFPELGVEAGDIAVQEGYVGRGYAVPTTKGLKAIELVKASSGLQLDWTYTGKTFAALIEEAPARRGETVLFWHTYNSKPLDLTGVDVRRLPHPLQAYFQAHR